MLIKSYTPSKKFFIAWDCLFNTSIKQQFIDCWMQDVSDGWGGKPLPVQGHHKGRQAADPPWWPAWQVSAAEFSAICELASSFIIFVTEKNRPIMAVTLLNKVLEYQAFHLLLRCQRVCKLSYLFHDFLVGQFWFCKFWIWTKNLIYNLSQCKWMTSYIAKMKYRDPPYTCYIGSAHVAWRAGTLAD